MNKTALHVPHAEAPEPRVRELARDAVCLMVFSVGVSVSLMCGMLAIATLVH